MRRSQASRALIFSSRLPAWPASSVASTWIEEQVGAGLERAQRGVALALVVRVEPAGGAGDLDDVDVGEHAEATDQVDGGDEPGLAARSGR